jgi:uncharacterized protein GlcG (DUF336 family)
MRTIVRLAIVGAALGSSASSYSQGVVTQRILSLAAATAIADGALAECSARGFRTAVVVVDRSGEILAVLRNELAHPMTVEMARRKAYTAVLFRDATSEFQRGTATDPARAAQRDVPGALALGGGVPIVVADEILGAVGSSGSNPTADDECARAGIAKAESLFERGPR